MSGLGGMDWINGLLGLAAMYQQDQQTQAANAANISRYNQAYGEVSGLRDRTLDTINSANQANAALQRGNLQQNRADLSQMGNQLYNLLSNYQQPIQSGFNQLSGQVNDQMRGRTVDYGRQMADVLSGYRGVEGQIGQGGADMQAAISGGYGDLTSGYQQRYQRGMGLLEGMGVQEGKDIRQDYAKSAADQQQSLIDRGMGSASLGATMAAGNQREQTDALGRLNERLRAQQFAADTSLSGDVLASQERGLTTGLQARDVNQARALAAANQTLGVQGQNAANMAQLSAEQINAMQNMGLQGLNMQQQFGAQLAGQQAQNLQNMYNLNTQGRNQEAQLRYQQQMMPLGYDIDLTNNLANLIAMREDVAPSESSFLQLMQGLGQSAAPAPVYEQPSAFGSIFGGAGTGAGMGSLAGVGIGLASGVPGAALYSGLAGAGIGAGAGGLWGAGSYYGSR